MSGWQGRGAGLTRPQATRQKPRGQYISSVATLHGGPGLQGPQSSHSGRATHGRCLSCVAEDSAGYDAPAAGPQHLPRGEQEPRRAQTRAADELDLAHGLSAENPLHVFKQ